MADQPGDDRWAWAQEIADGEAVDFDTGNLPGRRQLPPGLSLVTLVRVVNGERVLVARLAVDLPDIAEWNG